jgi:hypothetical protein
MRKMLPDRDRQLLTAYVDGELTGRQQRHVARLLRRSPEARALLEQMQTDSRVLRGLPRPPLPRDFAEPVVRTIVERRLGPVRRRSAPVPRVIPTWAGLAAAAAVLCVIGLASYFYFATFQRRQPDTGGRLAQHQPTNLLRTPGDHEKEKVVPAPPERPEVLTQRPKPEGPLQPSNQVAVQPKDQSGGKGKPAPPVKPKDEPVVTAPAMEMFELKAADVTAPLLLKIKELDQDGTRQKLLAELGKDSGFRLELPCRDGTRAFERLQGVLKANKVHLLIDQTAQDRLKKPNWKTNYVLFAENLTPDELARLLQAVGAEDKKAEAKKPNDSQLDRLVVTRMTKRDHKELSDLLGIDPTQVPARPEATKPAAKPGEATALALAFNPVRPRLGSTEIKKFLEGRKSARPGMIQVLLVLRNVNG